MSSQTSDPPALRSILLGLFVLWQLLFMLGESTCQLVGTVTPEENSNVRTVLHPFCLVTGAYARLTAQGEHWGMFTPRPAPHSAYLVVELYDDAGAGPTLVLSDLLEPEDLDDYWQPLGSSDRLLKYQFELVKPSLVIDDAELRRLFPAESREFVFDVVRKNWQLIRAYLLWRLRKYEEDHGAVKPPASMVLAVKAYRTPLPGQSQSARSKPVLLPYARWVRALEDSPDFLPVEAYDIEAKRFHRLRREEEADD